MQLRSKFSISISILIFLILTMVSGVLVYYETRQIQEELIARDVVVAERVVPLLSDDFGIYYTYQFDTYTRTVQDILAKYPDVLHFRILDLNGQVVVDSDELTQGKYQGTAERLINDQGISDIVAKGNQVQDFISYQGRNAIRIFSPNVDRYGTYRLMVEFTFSLQAVRDSVLQAGIFLIFLFGIALGLSVLLVTLLIAQITRPIGHLTQSAQAVSGGDLNRTIIIETNDEIGQLAGAFQEMVSSVKKSQEALLTKITELERVIRVTVGRELRMIELKKELKDKAPEGPSDMNNSAQ